MKTLLENNDSIEKSVDTMLGSMSLDEKVGQLMVFPLYGAFITPDIVDLIRRYHIGGLRITQKFQPGTDEHRRKVPAPDYLTRSLPPPDPSTYDRQPELDRISWTPREQVEAVNKLREMAMNRSSGIPLHLVFDQEGEGADFLFGQRLMPYPMGLRATGNPEVAYRAALAIGRQAYAMGANLIHSPVLDVNTNPSNPEIGPRSYSCNPDEVAMYAMASMKGFNEANIACTAKHFPGRGASSSDAHYGLPEIKLSREDLYKNHIQPFRKLIAAGVQAVMAAFTSYPALDPSGQPAAVSEKIIKGLLRDELGFNGIVTTDNIEMGGLLERYGMCEAAVMALNAGCDMILCRSYTPVRKALIESVISAVKDGRYQEKSLDQSVARILRFRANLGLFENGGIVDPDMADKPFNNKEIVNIASEAARKSTLLMRNADDVLPIKSSQKVLLVEQAHHFHKFINNSYSHPGLLWSEMCRYSDNVGVVLVNETVTEEDQRAVMNRLDWADVIVVTGYYNYRSRNELRPYLMSILGAAKVPVVVVANTPYEQFGAPAEARNVIVSFCPSGRENIRAVADTLFGKLVPTANLDTVIRSQG
jgi:beta-N-acetylhexosaminidase